MPEPKGEPAEGRKEATLTDAVSSYGGLVDRLHSILGLAQAEDATKDSAFEDPVCQTRDRMVRQNSAFESAIDQLEKKKIHLREAFGEKLL